MSPSLGIVVTVLAVAIYIVRTYVPQVAPNRWEPAGWAASSAAASMRPEVRLVAKLSTGMLLSLFPGLGHLVIGPRRWAPVFFVVACAGVGALPLGPGGLWLLAVMSVAIAHLFVWHLRREMPRAEYRLMEREARAEAARPSCPRCRAAERTATGWCEPCASVLAHAPVDVECPEVRATNWLTRSADAATRPFLGRRPILSNAGGRRVVLGAMVTRIVAKTERVAYPRQCATDVLSAFRDPEVPGVLWTRVLTRRGDVHGGAWESLAVWAHRFDDGRLAQSWEFVPISGGPLAPLVTSSQQPHIVSAARRAA
jgi:hypothetical protein